VFKLLKPLAVVGAGGLGREVAWLIRDINEKEPTWDFVGFIDDSLSGKTVEGYPIIGNFEMLEKMDPAPYVVCAIGDPVIRKSVVDRCLDIGLEFATLVHPSVLLSDFVEIGSGSVICAGTVLTTNIKIGAYSVLSPNCTMGHDSVLGDFASLMPATNIAGEVTVGEGCYFGINSGAINQVSIGEWSIIGAGAMVVNDIPPRVVAVGVPAKPIKQREA